jgi:4-amino-4-deoxy-L-arabinose transferase-like glycosyltransferase
MEGASRQRPTVRTRAALLCSAASLLLAGEALLATGVLQRFPASGDEYAYLLQGEIFASGRLSVPSASPDVRAAFTLDHVIDDGRIRSKYPPGWPALLAVGAFGEIPWLVNPIVATATVVVVWTMARPLFGAGAAIFAALLLAMSPMFLLMGASFHSHPFSLLLCSLSLHHLVRGSRTGSSVPFALSGAAVGLQLLVRPLDAVLTVAALAIGLGRRATTRHMAVFTAGAFPAGGLFLGYNALQFGDPLRTGYAFYRATFQRLYPNELPEIALVPIAALRPHLLWTFELLLWTAPLGLLFLLMGVRAREPGPERSEVIERTVCVRALWALAALVLAHIHLLPPNQGDSYGPRYLFLTLLPLAVLGGRAGAAWLRTRTRTALLLAGGAAVVFLIQMVEFCGEKHRRIDQLLWVARAADALDDAVVVLRETHLRRPHWYTRNGITRDRSVLLVVDAGPDVLRRLRTSMPDRRFYTYRKGRLTIDRELGPSDATNGGTPNSAMGTSVTAP